MRFHDGLGDGQPQPGARDGLLGGGCGAEEAVVDPALVGGGDADAGVGDGEHRLAAPGRELDLDLPTVRRELHRVGDEAAEHLGDAGRIEGGARDAGGRQRQADVLPPGLGPHLRHRGGRDLGEVGAARFHDHLSRVHAGEEEQIPDQAQQSLRVAVDDFHEAGGVEPTGAFVPEQFGVSDDGGQRSPQFVGDHPDELVLEPVEFAQALVLRAEQVSLLRERLLGLDLRGDVPGDPERADDLAAGVPQRHLGGRNPGIRPSPVGFSLHLSHNWLAGADNLLLIFEGGGGMLVAEDIEVGLPGQVLLRAAGGVCRDPAVADEHEPAEQVLEVHPLAGGRQQVGHARELELAHRLVLPRAAWLRRGPGYRAAPLSAPAWAPARRWRQPMVPVDQVRPAAVMRGLSDV